VTPTRFPLLSNSSLNTFRRCPREYYFRYVLLRKGRAKAAALRFGTLFHAALNAWWRRNGSALEKLRAALDALDAQNEEKDPFELAKARALIIGYTARWGEEGYETLAVEKQFRLPILDEGGRVFNASGQIGTTAPRSIGFDLGGAIDAIVNRRGRVRNVEHKTTSSDISVGSDYWRHVVAMDPQVSTYHAAAHRLGFAPVDTLYDVVRKPGLVPLLATPEESRKYTKPTKTEPIARLYKGQREDDETPEAYEARIVADIEENPGFYFARMPIVRLEHDDVEHARDVRETAWMIAHAKENHMWPRSPSACERFGRLCEYHDVCSGLATINDDARFVTKARQHEELDP
jgi:RecB family exonuclease